MRILVIILLISGCFLKKNINPEATIISTPIISMKRTACYGTCPQYTVNIYNDGLIQYSGKMFVDKIGCFTSFLNDEDIDMLKSSLKRIDFFSLEPAYISPITDIPSVIIEVNIDARKHQVIDRLLGPDELKQFQSEIDFVVDSVINWERCQVL